MSRKAIAVAAVAAVLTVSACSSEKAADIDGATLMSKVSTKLSSTQLDKLVEKDGVVTASIDFEATNSSSGKAEKASAKGDLEVKVDSEKDGVAVKAKGDFEGEPFKSFAKINKGSGSIEAYGEKTNNGGYRVYVNPNDKQWQYTSLAKADYDSFLKQMQSAAKQQSGNLKGQLDKLMSDAKQYVDVDVKEDGDDYIATVTPKDLVVNQLVSQAGKKGIKLNKNDVKVKFVVTVNKSDYSLKEFKADVDIKSTDDKYSVKGNANIKIEEKDVSIDVPQSAKNGKSVSPQELFGAPKNVVY